MSKILAAMNKATSDPVDLIQRIQTVDQGNLFPPPGEKQVQEFEQLADSLISLHGGTSGRSIVFASTYSGEGSSFVSYNCARYLTLLLNRKVAWIDANFKHPQKKIRKNGGPELKSLLLDPDQIAGAAAGRDLLVIGGGTSEKSTMDLLHGPQYARFLACMQDEFFFTIIDAPPILEGVEVTQLVQHTLGLVLVVESERLKHEVIAHGIERMRSQNVNVLGTVLNKRSFQLPEFLYRRL